MTMDGRIPFVPGLPDGSSGPQVDSAEADALASGVDPQDLGLDEDATPEDADTDPEATP